MFIAPSAYTLGGIQTWLDYLLPGLSDAGWDVILGLVSGRFHRIDRYLDKHPFNSVVEISAPTGTREGRIDGLMSAITAVDPDIIAVLNIVDAYIAAARVRVKKRKKLRIVATLHGIQADFLNDYSVFKNDLDGIICTNQLAKKLAKWSSRVCEDRILYAPYGVDIPSFKQRAHNNAKSVILGYSGRLEVAQKRIYDICSILERGVWSGLDLSMIIAGDGPEKEAVATRLQRNGMESRVRFLGILDETTLRRQVYRQCDVLLVTSEWEAGPIVAWEAMSEGAILVTSDYVGRRCEGSLKDNVNCLVFPIGDASSAVDCLHRLREEGVRRRIATAGRQLVVDKYSRQQSIERWAECFGKIMKLPDLVKSGETYKSPPTGRLDRYLGTRSAEIVRRLVGRGYDHDEAGGEWPHSYGGRAFGVDELWKIAREFEDRGSAM